MQYQVQTIFQNKEEDNSDEERLNLERAKLDEVIRTNKRGEAQKDVELQIKQKMANKRPVTTK